MSRAEFLGTFELNFGYTRIYGLFVEFLSAAAQHVIPGDLWVVRHYVNAVFGWTGVVFAFLMARRFFGVRAGWLAAALLACMPRYMADSMNNPKDLPFAVLMLAASYYVLSVKEHYPYLSWPHALKLGAAIALAVNVRSMGLLLLGYAGLALAIAIVAARDFDPRRLAATAGRFAVVTLVALVGGAAFWPWAQEQPLTRPFEAFFLASGFSWGNPSLFMGEAISGAAVPWYYLPTWIGITIPAVVLAGLAFAVVRLALPAPGACAPGGAVGAGAVSGRQRDGPSGLPLRRHAPYAFHRSAHGGPGRGRVGTPAAEYAPAPGFLWLPARWR